MTRALLDEDDSWTRRPVPRRAGLVRALTGWLVLFGCLGVVVGAAERVTDVAGLPVSARAVLQAVLLTSLVVPAVVLLRRRVDRSSTASLGWGAPRAVPVLTGALVALTTGAVVWACAWAAGWITVARVDTAQLLLFLAVNLVVICLYEAVPEELALRGYVWTNLRDGWGLLAATVVTTVLFALGGVVVSSAGWLTTALLGGGQVPFTAFPAGMDPVVYVVQLVTFGLALVAARRLPVAGALWAAISFHALQLTVTRLVLGGLGWLPSGVSVDLASPDVLALVLVHIALGGAAFVVFRKHLERRRASSSAPLPTRERP